jgi:antirestriction protein ArdC
VPDREQFEKPAENYGALFHELGHSTGHPNRLHRFEVGDPGMHFGSEDYSREELCAELTSCAVLANMGVETTASFRNNAAYIQSWVRVLKEDSHAVIRASAKAEQAYNMIMGIKNKFEEGDEVETSAC